MPVVSLADFRERRARPRPPRFDAAFRADFEGLLRWRRDVRGFRPEPLSEPLVEELLDLACLSPSVGNAQPWRFVRVSDAARRAAVIETFERCNAAALAEQALGRQALYARLKLAGLREAPLQLAVFCDEATGQGHGLGRATMPETLAYSCVMAVQTLWLAARTRGVGVGWVSILEPDAVARVLEVPPGWRLVAYLCLGWPQQQSETPELERSGWQSREAACREVLER